MTRGDIWIVIIGGMLITYALRASFLLFFGKDSLPLWLFRSLRFTPAVVLAALIAQLVVKTGSEIQISFQNPKIIAAMLASLVAWKTKNSIITLLTGMAALWILSYFMK